jgi:hypothetical protein
MDYRATVASKHLQPPLLRLNRKRDHQFDNARHVNLPHLKTVFLRVTKTHLCE